MNYHKAISLERKFHLDEHQQKLKNLLRRLLKLQDDSKASKSKNESLISISSPEKDLSSEKKKKMQQRRWNQYE